MICLQGAAGSPGDDGPPGDSGPPVSLKIECNKSCTMYGGRALVTLLLFPLLCL